MSLGVPLDPRLLEELGSSRGGDAQDESRHPHRPGAVRMSVGYWEGSSGFAAPDRWASRFNQGFIVSNYSRVLRDLHAGEVARAGTE